uniref:Uncharacterized protein n=1 Tax=Minutocellus polymorphus TaxID=265543 RepID=A0A7S0B2Q7_9STRA|mmetsp:Transcript_9527/g.15824  ORF Transcript_9527/g.15824 Transcript_9527/m.15824 type:complete len:185 (+) Transcript_9527:78-632(+)
MELSLVESEQNGTEEPLNGAPASVAPRIAYHVVGSTDRTNSNREREAPSSTILVTVLIMVLGTLLGLFLSLVSLAVLAFSFFTADSGMDGLLHLGGWVWLLAILIMLLAINVFSVSYQYAMSQKNGSFVVESLGVLLVYGGLALLFYYPMDWVLTPTLDVFFGDFIFGKWLMRWGPSLWLARNR